MRRWTSFLFPILLAQCLDGSSEGTTAPIKRAAIVISSTPVAFDRAVGGRRNFGGLRLLGAWQLASPSRLFGGLSGLSANGADLTAISDVGAIVQFRVGRFGTLSGGQILPIPKGCAIGYHDSGTDAEAITRDNNAQNWWIALEGRNEICRLDATLSAVRASAKPAAMRTWQKKRGPETMLRLADGRMLVIAEGRLGDITDTEMVLFEGGDPTAPTTRVAHMRYRPPAGYNPTDAAQLPDGRLLILHRRFYWRSVFTAKLSVVDLAALTPGADVNGREIATFASPVITDNYEALAVSREGDQTIIWIASDDNYLRWQKTLLLKFAFDETGN